MLLRAERPMEMILQVTGQSLTNVRKPILYIIILDQFLQRTPLKTYTLYGALWLESINKTIPENMYGRIISFRHLDIIAIARKAKISSK